MKYAAMTALLVVPLIVACARTSPLLDPPGAELGFAMDPLPRGEHVTSSTQVIDGADYAAAGEGTTPQPPALLIDGTGLTCSWALYAYGLEEGETFNSVALDVEDVSGVYWLGLADYGGGGTWEWHGPYVDDATVVPVGDAQNYVSPDGNVYWLVVAPRDSSLLLVSSTIDYVGSIVYYVPPPGVSLAAFAPASLPSLVILPEVADIAEEGAPVIFYMTGDGEAADTHVAFFDGQAWTSQVLFPDGPRVTHPVARLIETGAPGFLIAAYDPAEDRAYVYLLDFTLMLTVRSELRGNAEGTLTGLAMDCLSADNWCVAEVRRTEEGSTVVARYEDEFDNIKDPYLHALPGEEVAGLDVARTGEQWMTVFSHGTIDQSELVLLDFELAVVTVSMNDWTLAPTDYSAPLVLDLSTDGADRAQLLFVAGHDWQSPLPDPYDITATLYYDVVLGTHNGNAWDYEPLYEGELTIHILSGEVDLSAGVDVSWAAADALSYSAVDGTLEFTLSPEFAITGGQLLNDTAFMERSDGSFTPSAYYTGGAGLSLSWNEGPGGPCCAYVSAEEVDIEELLGGHVTASGDLMYWSPGAA